MKDYKINEKGSNCLEFSFIFDKSYTLMSSAVSLIFILFIIIKIGINNFTDFFFITGLAFTLSYISLNSWFEWNKNKYHKFSKEEEDLIINSKMYCKTDNILSVNISYNINQFESGWKVYLHGYLKSTEYVVKERLEENDAHIIAGKLSSFLNKPIVIDN